jgi:deoxyribodipyrimidine photo-lyase
VIPSSLEGLVEAILRPLAAAPLTKDPPPFPSGAKTVHPFKGGESHAHARLVHLLSSGVMSTYHNTRNGLLGLDFSSKLSAYLSQGCITARQVHASMLALEDGTNSDWSSVPGFGEGESEGMKSMRFELLWRDYMRLCNRKFGPKLFPITGFKGTSGSWISPSHPGEGKTKEEVADMIDRFLNGTTGMGLIDASQRELFHTGYTSNRARQNVASFLAKHLYIDWRIGAEWYESMLVDYDLSSNWGNWQYVAGVGNDPRESRSFNPVKQAFDYDPQAEYVKTWIEELRGVENPAEVFQAWTMNQEARERAGLGGVKWVEKPLKRIEFTVGRKGPGQMRNRGRGGGPAGEGGNRGKWHTFAGRGRGQGRGGYGGRGYGSSRGHLRGRGDGPRGGGREARTGMMDKVHEQQTGGGERPGV